MKKKYEKLIGKDMVKYVCNNGDIRESMLASLLGVSVKSLNNWSEFYFDYKNEPKFERLKKIYIIVANLKEKNIKGKYILNELNEPINKKNELSYLDYIIDKNILIEEEFNG